MNALVARATPEEKALRARIARLRARIAEITAQLATLAPKSGAGRLLVVNVEDSASFEAWITRCKQAQLREALLLDLAELRAQLKLLQADLGSVRRRYAWPIGEALLKLAQQHSSRLKKTTKHRLEAAVRNRELSLEQLRLLRHEHEAVLNEFAAVLDATPSERNIKLTIEQLEPCLLLGASMDASPVARALGSLQRASLQLLGRALDAFRKKPTRAHAAAVLDRLRQATLLGVSSSKLSPAYEEVRRSLRRP